MRAAGILLHPTSLPGPGVGEVGRAAHDFMDWLAGAGQALWQVLPLVPVGESGSPYNGLSAMAGNPLLIDLHSLAREGLLDAGELRDADLPADRVDYPAVVRWKAGLLRKSYTAFRAGAAPSLRRPFREFRARYRSWLDDYALFQALREQRDGRCWTEWERPIRLRDASTLQRIGEDLADEIGRHTWEQFIFDRQWMRLRRHARRKGVRIIGDIPIFVALDSADVWAHPELFRLDESGRPEVVSGVPPDYFSETGQRWGNPLYRWDTMAKRGFRWWTERFRRTLELVDVARIDHFRGFEAFWEIPASADTALGGEWRPGPGRELFDAVERDLGPLPLIAEDLGLITSEVEALRDELGLPGMRVLQFAFDGDPDNPHLPENHPRRAVAYTGTHDNDTILGWWSGAGAEERERARRLADLKGEELNWAMVRLAFESPAERAVVPLQDVLGLGSEARMNTPGVGRGNWEWRLGGEALTCEIGMRLLELTRSSGRQPAPPRGANQTQTASQS